MIERRMSNNIDAILEERRRQHAPQAQTQVQPQAGEALPAMPESEVENRFYQTRRIEGEEHCLELRFNTGIVTFFKYSDVNWCVYDPDAGMIDICFMGFVVSITGRGLVPDLLEGIKTRRISWVKEADTNFQEDEKFPVVIKSISVAWPEGFGEGGDEPEQTS